MSKASTVASILLAAVAAFISLFGFVELSTAQAPLEKVNVRLGWQPLSGGSAAIAMYMIREKLFEKEAAMLK